MTREEKVAVVESYVHGLGNGDFSSVPFADDVSYESPLTPKRIGKEAIDFLAALFPKGEVNIDPLFGDVSIGKGGRNIPRQF